MRLLHERQAREVDQFDEESTRLGFRSVQIEIISGEISLFWLIFGLFCSGFEEILKFYGDSLGNIDFQKKFRHPSRSEG